MLLKNPWYSPIKTKFFSVLYVGNLVGYSIAYDDWKVLYLIFWYSLTLDVSEEVVLYLGRSYISPLVV